MNGMSTQEKEQFLELPPDPQSWRELGQGLAVPLKLPFIA